MARPQSPPSPGRPSLDAQREEVAALKRLLGQEPRTLSDHRAIGAQMRRLADDRGLAVRSSGWRKEVAAAVGMSGSQLTKCLRFFDGYTTSEVAQLEELGVTWLQVDVASSIEAKEERLRLFRRARAEDWGVKDLRHEARRLKGASRGGGRPRKQEKSRGCLADAAELARLARQWIAFHGQAWVGNQERYLAELGRLGADASAGLGHVLEDAEEKLAALQGRCAAALETVRNLRRKLPQCG